MAKLGYSVIEQSGRLKSETLLFEKNPDGVSSGEFCFIYSKRDETSNDLNRYDLDCMYDVRGANEILSTAHSFTGSTDIILEPLLLRNGFVKAGTMGPEISVYRR